MSNRDLIKSIMTAKAKLEEYGCNPNVIVINRHKYTELKTFDGRVLAICGMEVEFEDLPLIYDYYIPSERKRS